jgi:hypothetical protein
MFLHLTICMLQILFFLYLCFLYFNFNVNN